MKIFFLLTVLLFWGITEVQTQNLPADLDSRFGNNGAVISSPGIGYGIIEYGGRFVVAGASTITYYGDDGTLLYQVPTLLPNGSGYFQAVKIALQFDPASGQTKFLVAGFIMTSVSNNDYHDIILARYDDSLNLDTTFGNGGFVQTQINSKPVNWANDITCQPDGKIVIVGGTGQSASALNQFIARYQPNGSPDSSFGNMGVTETPIGIFSQAGSVQFTYQGIFVGGYTQRRIGIPNDATVARYDLNGNLDPAFNGRGLVIFRYGTSATVFVDNFAVTVTGIQNGVADGFGLARLNLNGQLDQSFGSGGFSIRSTPTNLRPNSMIKQPDGKFVVAGYAYDFNTARHSLFIARYNYDGTPDQNFTASCCQPLTGIRLFNLNKTSNDVGYGLVNPLSGKLVVAGYSINGNTQSILLTQFNGN